MRKAEKTKASFKEKLLASIALVLVLLIVSASVLCFNLSASISDKVDWVAVHTKFDPDSGMWITHGDATSFYHSEAKATNTLDNGSIFIPWLSPRLEFTEAEYSFLQGRQWATSFFAWVAHCVSTKSRNPFLPVRTFARSVSADVSLRIQMVDRDASGVPIWIEFWPDESDSHTFHIDSVSP